MKRVALAVVLMALSSVFPLLCAQKVSVIPLVPAANWQLTSKEGLSVADIKNYGGDPAVESEYGVKSFEVRTYQLGGASVQVVLESAVDVSAAFGLLTYYQNESMHPEKTIELAMTGPQGSMMARGRSLIRFLRPKGSQVSDNDFRALMILVGGTRPTRDSLENLPPLLPTSGLIPGSTKYIVGPVTAQRVLPNLPTDLIGFDQGAEIQLGEYHVGNSRSTVVELSYPTPHRPSQVHKNERCSRSEPGSRSEFSLRSQGRIVYLPGSQSWQQIRRIELARPFHRQSTIELGREVPWG